MKKKFLNFSLKLIKEKYPEYDDIKMDEVRYGLEGLYLTFSKMIIIIPLSIILGVFKEFIILLIAFNFLRTPAHGLHATKSWICLLSSSLIFVGIPFLLKLYNPTLNIYIKLIIGIISIILLFLYAPADTKKAPIIREEKRKKYKQKSIIYCIILISFSIFIKNKLISNLFISGIIIEIIMILPLTYRIFNLSYNNYKTYILNMD